MKTTFYLFLILISNLFAQQDSVSNWQFSAVAGLNISQIALSEWTQGGDNTFAWTIINDLKANYSKDLWSFKNNLKVGYGQTKLGSNPYITNDNELYLESVLSYYLAWKINPYFSNTVRTILANGYNYKISPDPPQIAAFFDPGYINQSIGFEYIPIENFSTRVGIGFQEVITNKFNFYTDDKDTKDKVEKFKFDTGIESVTEGNLTVAENMSLNTKLRLFGKFKKIDQWDVRWDNTIIAKVNNYVNVNLNVLLVYQVDQSLKTQLKEALQIGLTYTLF